MSNSALSNIFPSAHHLSSIQVMRCVREARQYAVEHRADIENIAATAQAYRHRKDDSLCVKNWLPGSYSRLKRALESAVTHPTGRGIPILWRMYMALEVCSQRISRIFFSCPEADYDYHFGVIFVSITKQWPFLPTPCPGHARKSHASETLVLASDPRVPWQ